MADVCSEVPNLDNSVDSDCGDTQLQRGETRTARCAPGSVHGVGDTEQSFSCQPDGVVSSTQPVCEPLPEYCVNVGLDSVDERSCLVSCTSPYAGAAGVRQPEPWWLSPVGLQGDFARSNGHSVLSFGLRCQRHVRCPCPVSGTSRRPRWDSSQVCPAGFSWSGIRRLRGYPVVVSVTIAEKKAPVVEMRRTRVCGTTAPPLKINNPPLTCSSECCPLSSDRVL